MLHGCVTFITPLRVQVCCNSLASQEHAYFCRMKKNMNKTIHVTYELPCTHDKRSQISLRHTLRTCVCVKHDCSVVVCQSMLYQHSSSSKSWPSRLLQCRTSLLPSFGCIVLTQCNERCCFWEHLKKDVYRWELF